MKLRRSFLLLGLTFLTSCQPSTTSLRVGGRDGNALKVTLTEARLVVLDNTNEIASVNDVLMIMEDEGLLRHVEPFGLSNLFLNPDLSIWMGDIISNSPPADVPAAVIRVNSQYSAIFFDGRLSATPDPPAEWCAQVQRHSGKSSAE